MSINYDTLAKIYDSLYGAEQRRKHIVITALLKSYNIGSLLDAGCGTGMLEDLLGDIYYVCLDLSAGMLQVYVGTHRRRGDPVMADMRLPPLRCCFDAVVTVTSLHEAPEATGKLLGLVKPGGVFIVSLKEGLPRPPTPEGVAVEKVVEAAGDIVIVYRRLAARDESFNQKRDEL